MGKLSKTMTLRQFDHGYWYATEIKRFAKSIGVPHAHKLRKNELETPISHFLSHGTIGRVTRRNLSRDGVKDSDRPLTLNQRVILSGIYYIYFLKDFMAANPGAPMAAGIRAWKAAKTMDAVKTYKEFVRGSAKA